MNKILRDCFKGIAYVYYHPEESEKQKLLESLFTQAWRLGYPKTYFYHKSDLTNEIQVEDMTEWEIEYIFKDIS